MIDNSEVQAAVSAIILTLRPVFFVVPQIEANPALNDRLRRVLTEFLEDFPAAAEDGAQAKLTKIGLEVIPPVVQSLVMQGKSAEQVVAGLEERFSTPVSADDVGDLITKEVLPKLAALQSAVDHLMAAGGGGGGAVVLVTREQIEALLRQ